MELFEAEKADAVKFLRFLYKRLPIILVVSLLGLITGLVVTFFIPPKYYSYGVVFPTNANAGLSVLEDPRFGYSLDADQLMQLLESEALRDSIIHLYKLDEYYGVDKSKKTWKQQLEKRYLRDITCRKTRYYSIVIMATTRDPELSANIVNSIIEVVDVLRARILRKNQQIAFEYARDQYLHQQQLVDSLQREIYRIKDPKQKGDLLYNFQLAASHLYGPAPTEYVNSPELEPLMKEYTFNNEILKGLKVDYEKANRLIQKPLSKVYVVSYAKPNYKKASPSYTANGTIGFFAALVFIILLLIVIDRIQSILPALRS